MLNKSISVYVLMFFLISFQVIFSSQSYAMEEVEYSIEDGADRFYLGKDLNGFVTTKKCPTCQEVRYTITKDIKAYKYSKEVPLSNFVMYKNPPDLLRFDKKSKKLTKLVWYLK